MTHSLTQSPSALRFLSSERVRKDLPFMIHYTCDLCAGNLQGDQRFIVNMEVVAAHDPTELTEDDLDEDHLEAVSQQIQEMEQNAEQPDLTPTMKQFRYDLCTDCHRRFLRDPLGRERSKKVAFCKN